MKILIVTIFLLILFLFRQFIRLQNPNFTYLQLFGIKNFNFNIKGVFTLNPYGLVFGQKGVNFICKHENEEGHVLIVGGSGSGKSSCIIIPTLLSWRSRVFAIDIKGELKKTTSQKRGNVKYFDIEDSDSWGYDPFYLLNVTDNVSEVVNDIAISLIPVPTTVNEPFWVQSAQNLFKAFLYYFIHLKHSFVQTIDAIVSTNVVDLVNEISESSNIQAKQAISTFVGLKTETLLSIYIELSNKIVTFTEDYKLKKALSKTTTIKPSDLYNYDVYIVIQESKLEQLSNLLTLIINQFLKSFERREERNSNPVLFILDEFPRLGKINSIIGGLGTLRSKNITMCLVIQSLAQIEAIYGTTIRKIISDNCNYKAILSASDPETQHYFSSLIGTRKIEKKTYTKSQGEGLMRKTSEASTYVDEPIIKPETLAYIKEILLISPKGYMWVEKTPYYSHPVLKSKPNLPKLTLPKQPPPEKQSVKIKKETESDMNELFEYFDSLAGEPVKVHENTSKPTKLDQADNDKTRYSVEIKNGKVNIIKK